jgi:thiol-disulfide isomerase/thioredoxin
MSLGKTGNLPPPPPGGGNVPAGGIVAGQVIDNWNRRPAATVIQVALVQEKNEAKAAPIEVTADSQGYFLIQGLQPGRHYRLIARARDGDQLLAGTVWVTPPNPRVVIRMSSELAGSTTPPLPAGPGSPVPQRPPPPSWPGGADSAWAPGRSPANPSPDRPAALGGPQPGDESGNPANVPVAPDRIGSGPPTAMRDPPPVSIPSIPAGQATEWAPANPNAPANPPTVAGPSAAANPAPPPIPFCSLSGRQLSNFGLYDLNGHPWEWRQRNNRLTLIDFWWTGCAPCLHAIPHLNILQDRYHAYGLEVVGIAYEQGLPQHRAEKVRNVAQRLRINYTLLLGGERLSCPVRTQFRVAAWPTLVLVDQEGRLLWQESGLDRAKFNELERIIRQQLGIR